MWIHPAPRSYRSTAPTTRLIPRHSTRHRTSSAALLSTASQRQHTRAQDLAHSSDDALALTRVRRLTTRAHHAIVPTSVLLGSDSRIGTVGDSRRFHLSFIAAYSLDTCRLRASSLCVCHLYWALCVARRIDSFSPNFRLSAERVSRFLLVSARLLVSSSIVSSSSFVVLRVGSVLSCRISCRSCRTCRCRVGFVSGLLFRCRDVLRSCRATHRSIDRVVFCLPSHHPSSILLKDYCTSILPPSHTHLRTIRELPSRHLEPTARGCFRSSRCHP